MRPKYRTPTPPNIGDATPVESDDATFNNTAVSLNDDLVARLEGTPEVPSAYALVGDKIEDLFDPGLRHQSGKKPFDYLKQWLSMLRPFAYATQDDSWGEMEKLLCIVMRNYVRQLRLAPKAAAEITRLQAVVAERDADIAKLGRDFGLSVQSKGAGE